MALARRKLPSEPVESRGWYPARGLLLRTRSRGGAESKQKFATYAEAASAGRAARATGMFREIWVEEVTSQGPKPWRDLDADRRERHAGERAHVLNVEEDGE